MKKLQTFDTVYFRGKSHFDEDGTENYIVFQSIYRYFKRFAGVDNGNYVYFCKSKGLSYENISRPVTPNYCLTPKSSYFGTKAQVEFNRSCLKFKIKLHIVMEKQ